MTPTLLLYCIIAIIVINYIKDLWLDLLNAKNFDAPIPKELQDVYDKQEYEKSQAYKKERFKFSMLTGLGSVIATVLFFLLDGFAFLDRYVKTLVESPMYISLLFFGLIFIASTLLTLPLEYYSTFVIEEKYGFNTSTIKTFILDKIKSICITIVLGGGILSAFLWFYTIAGNYFWVYAWGLVTVFTLFMNMFYAKLIVPIFNKQSPLEKGSLRDKIEAYAAKVGFKLNNIFIIDGSKRSTKANAYFSGFGTEKRITLYDTLVNDLNEEEIVAVLAHEVGHYKHKHIITNLVMAIVNTGIVLYVLSLVIDSELLSNALGVTTPSFHIGLIAFSVLFTPLSELTGLGMNYISRKFEYQADTYAKQTYGAAPLISSLKKLSKNSLSNLTPHPAYVQAHYSHPTLYSRYKNLIK